MSEHAVIIHFRYGSKNLDSLFALEEKLESAILKAEAGEYDGNEVGMDGSDAFLYMYGPDADILFETVRPILEASGLMKDATAVKRYGPPEEGVKRTQVRLGLSYN
ncbi:MAG: hypothetical protein HY665_04590 [Chloroflexi bacterium]|nr:hypothetical protein [Chloroflexota bacterium]